MKSENIAPQLVHKASLFKRWGQELLAIYGDRTPKCWLKLGASKVVVKFLV